MNITKIKESVLGLAVLGLVEGGIYRGCVADRIIENAVVTEIGSYKSYYDAESPVYDWHSYIKLNTRSDCLDIEKYAKDELNVGDSISLLRYNPEFLGDCDEVVYLKRK